MTGARVPYDQTSSDAENSASSSSNDSTPSSSPSIGAADINGPLRTELQQLQHAISRFISNLYKVSIIVRKHTVSRDRLVKSAKIDTSFYEYFDEKHVREKYPLADEALVKRLGNANSRRRKYFKYREQHRQKLSSRQDAQLAGQSPAGETVHRPVVEENLNLPTNHEEAETMTHGDHTPSLMSPSGVRESTTASTFHPPHISALRSDAFDRLSEAGTQTSYGSTSSIQGDILAIPPPPKNSLDGREFECPYCFTICCLRSTDPWQQHKEWKRHVLRDIQPYVCTFGGCSQTDALFERRRDWIAHELQRHRTEWCCNVPGHLVYGSHKEFQSHMQHQHPDSIDDGQLDSLTEMVARPAVNLKFSCPLCCSERFSDLNIDRLEQHLGRHLEVIATFALPQGRMASPESQRSAATQNANPSDTGDGDTDELGDDCAADDRSHSSDELPAVSLSNVQDDVIDGLNEDWGFLSVPALRLVEPSEPSHTDGFATESPHPVQIDLMIEIEKTCDWLTTDTQARLFKRFVAMRRTGTGLWFLESENYEQWRESDIDVLLVEGLR